MRISALLLALPFTFTLAATTAGLAQAASIDQNIQRLRTNMERSLCRAINNPACHKNKSQKKKAARPATRKAAPSKPDVTAKPAPAAMAKPATAPPIPPPIPKPKPAVVVTPTVAPKSPPPDLASATAARKAQKHSAMVVPRIKPAPVPPSPMPSVVNPPVPPPPITTNRPVAQGDFRQPADLQGEQCLAALRAIGADFTIAATPVSVSPCGIDNPVRLGAVATDQGRVILPEQPMLACRFAVQMSQWVKHSAAPIAQRHDKVLAKIWTGPGFQCRGRNGDASAKISEHGFGNAVDIERMALTDGHTVTVADAGSSLKADHGLLSGLRQSACAWFTTVLGPGANAAHASHFHFDLGQHGKSGTYRICE